MEDLVSPAKVTTLDADTVADGTFLPLVTLVSPSGVPFGPSKSIISPLTVCGVGVPDRARPSVELVSF